MASPSADVRLSICIPTLNRGRFIGATLQSVVSQAGDGVEIVIIDGGSTDDTPAVVRSFQARFPRLHYFRSDGNGTGPSLGGFDRDCNLAVERARGEYCWLFTDDDLLKPGAVAGVLEQLDRGFCLLIANAEVRSADLSKLIEENRLAIDQDRRYRPGEEDRLLAETGTYLSFVGGVVIRRDLWLSRDRTRPSGPGFVHVGVLFQERLPGAVLVIARPLITIRYGNASWAKRWFPIWMFDWPDLVWSLPGLSAAAKRQVCPREPARRLGRLLGARAIGTYSLQEYRTWLAPRFPSGPRRWAAKAIALLPGALLNPLGLAYYSLFVAHPSVALADLRASPFFIGNQVDRLVARWRSR